METNGSNPHPPPHENHPSTGSNNANKDQSTEKRVFVNRAEITWHEIRRQWVGDQSPKLKRMPREPIMRWASELETKQKIAFDAAVSHLLDKRFPSSMNQISWTTTYEDLLCSTELFQQPIPLAEMVDFLVDIWHEEGLYD